MSRYVEPPSVSGRVVFKDVVVVDPADGSRSAGQDVLVEGARIAAIAASGSLGPDARVVEGAGRHIVPGLVDMHTHVLNTPDDVDGAYALMLANGVVGFRQMSGNPRLLASRRAGTLPAPAGAPTLLAMPGDLLTPMNASSAENAVATVRRQHRDGADFIKAGMTENEAFLAGLAEARRLGIPFGGHLPGELDPREAANGGVGFIEHLGPGVTVFAAACSCEAEVRTADAARKLPSSPKIKIPGAGRLIEKKLRGIVVNPATLTSETEARAYDLADESYDAHKAEALAELFVRQGTWQCPTLIRMHTQQFGDAPQHTQDPRRRFMAAQSLHAWDESARQFAKLPEATRESLRRHWDGQLRLTKAFADAGVPMLAGTDACGAAGVVPGFALHDEFDLLAAAGLDPLTILRMATTQPARFLGLGDAAGRVAVGLPADMVLLDADPLEDHGALRKIAGVMKGGAWWSRAELDQALDRVAASPGAR